MNERESVLTDEGLARRKFLKQAATVAWASPVIVTMLSRTAHAQQPCGTQVPDPVVEELVICDETNPCGTLGDQCVPDPDAPGVGNGCVCLP